MSKYKVKFNGEFEDEVFDSEREADEYARYLVLQKVQKYCTCQIPATMMKTIMTMTTK